MKLIKETESRIDYFRNNSSNMMNETEHIYVRNMKRKKKEK